MYVSGDKLFPYNDGRERAAMRAIINVDGEKCIHCGMCVRDCMQQCLALGADGMPELDYRGGYGGCGACQHCMAVCPTGALSWGGIDPEALRPAGSVDAEDMLSLIMSRRSVRQFKDADVPPEKLRKLADMLAYPPRGSNADSLRFSLVGSCAKMREIADATYAAISPGSPFANMLLSGRDAGRDMVYWNAPAMLVAFVSRTNVNPSCRTVDPIISLTYAELYAESLGLGCVWCEIATSAIRQFPTVQRLVEMPAGYDVGYAMPLGEPAVRYRRAVLKDLEVARIIT